MHGVPGYGDRVPRAEEGAKLNQSVRKAITLLRAAAEDGAANVSSLARAAGLPRATALRMIQTLEQEGFLTRVPGDDRVLLGPGLLQLARSADERFLLREVARPVLEDLVAAVRETVTVSVVGVDGGLDLVAQVDAPQLLRPRSWLDQRFPLHASASGKLLLASYDEDRLARFFTAPLARFTASTITDETTLRTELERVRRRRWAVTRDEDEEGLTGIGAMVLGPGGASGGRELVGVVCVSGPTQRLDQQGQAEVVDELLQAVERIQDALYAGPGRSATLEVVPRTGS